MTTMEQSYMDLFTTSEQVYTSRAADQWPEAYSSNSVESSPNHSHYSYDSYSSKRSKAAMNDADKTIYNSLGSTSSPAGKLTYRELNLNRGWQKRGTMWKTGPNPAWYSAWRKRVFVLKGNFVYYLAPQASMEDAKVLGAIYLKNSAIEKDSLPLAKFVLKITPNVPRRPNSSDDDSAIFYIKFQSEDGREEWFEELHQVAFNSHHPEDTTTSLRI